LRRNSLAAVLLASVLAPPAAATDTPWPRAFPKAEEVFPPLTADPRETQLALSYYRRQNKDDSDVALGHSWGLLRWRSGEFNDWLWEWDMEGMAYSRFQMGVGVNKFETVDFFANLPVTVRKDELSFRTTLFHQSSHLGDDYIRDTGNPGFRYSVEGVREQAALEAGRFLRLYAGAQYLFHSIPDPHHWQLQSGFELTSVDLHWSARVPTHLFLAEDLQSRENAAWNLNSNTIAGVKIGFRESVRVVRVQVGYFTGHSPFGQFYNQREHYADVALAFEL